MSEPLKEFLASIPNEGDEVSLGNQDAQEGEAPAGSPAEDSQTETAPSPGGANNQEENNVPFHKHPRWIEMRDEKARLEARLAELESRQQQPAPQQEAPRETAHGSKIPDWFVKLYGENYEAYEAYQEHVREERKAIRDSLEQEERQRAETQRAEAERWNSWAKRSMETIDERHGANLMSDESRRKDFLSFVLKYKPTDDSGNIDMVKGWELYQLRNSPDPAKASARKAAADRVQSDAKPAEKPKKDYLTSQELRRTDWRDLF